MIAAEGFTCYVDGVPVEFAAGATVPADVVKECNLVEKGLVNEVGRKAESGRKRRA